MKSKDMFKRIEEKGLDYIFEFGKFKGIPVTSVLEIDPSYLFWAEENVSFFLMDTDLYREAITKLSIRIITKRQEKKQLISNTNNEIDCLSEKEKSKNRRKFWKNKE